MQSGCLELKNSSGFLMRKTARLFYRITYIQPAEVKIDIFKRWHYIPQKIDYGIDEFIKRDKL